LFASKVFAKTDCHVAMTRGNERFTFPVNLTAPSCLTKTPAAGNLQNPILASSRTFQLCSLATTKLKTLSITRELLKTLGVPYIVDDLYSLDPEALSALKPLHALIFLFKWLPSAASEPSSTAGEYDTDFPGFFAQQTVNNACATLAVINALGNIPSLPSGTQLADLMSFTTGMDPQTCGMAVASADWLREAHNALSPPSAISLDGLGLPKKTEEAYHFVVYIPVTGSVYELDGLKPYPVCHGKYDESGEGWLKKAR
jgi:ubiquitin carboxyl-terminal hydrolase L5